MPDAAGYDDLAGLGEDMIDGLVSRWTAEHQAETFWPCEIATLVVGTFTYLVENHGGPDERLLGAWGRSQMCPGEPPRTGAGDPNGINRAIALSIGGATTSFNVVPRLASDRRQADWHALEDHCHRLAGTFLFVRLVHEDGRLACIDYGVDLRDETFSVKRFERFNVVR